MEIDQRPLRFDLHCIEVPSGRSSGACIISRDRYRDYRKLIDDPYRLMAGSVDNDAVRVPALAIAAPLAASIEQAWQHWSLESGPPPQARS